MLSLFLLVITLAMAPKVVVVEAMVTGQKSSPEVGSALAAAIHAEQLDADLISQRALSPQELAQQKAVAEALFADGVRSLRAEDPEGATAPLVNAQRQLRRLVQSEDSAAELAAALGRVDLALAVALHVRAGGAGSDAGTQRDALAEAVAMIPEHAARDECLRSLLGEGRARARYGSQLDALRVLPTRADEQAELQVIFLESDLSDAELGLDGHALQTTNGRAKWPVSVGLHRLFVQVGSDRARVYPVLVHPGYNEVRLDRSFDRAFGADLALHYASVAERQARAVHHAGRLAKLIDADATLLHFQVGDDVHLALVNAEGKLREERHCKKEGAAEVARELLTPSLPKAPGSRPEPETSLFLRSGLGKVAVEVSARKGTWQVGIADERSFDPACETPCTLHLPAGPVKLSVRRSGDEERVFFNERIPFDGLSAEIQPGASKRLRFLGKAALGLGGAAAGVGLGMLLIQLLPSIIDAGINQSGSGGSSSGNPKADLIDFGGTYEAVKWSLLGGGALLGGAGALTAFYPRYEPRLKSAPLSPARHLTLSTLPLRGGGMAHAKLAF